MQTAPVKHRGRPYEEFCLHLARFVVPHWAPPARPSVGRALYHPRKVVRNHLYDSTVGILGDKLASRRLSPFNLYVELSRTRLHGCPVGGDNVSVSVKASSQCSSTR